MKTSKSHHHLQPEDSQWCGPACLSFALGKFKENYSTQDIARSLPISKKHGIGLFDLARYPISKGYQVDLYAWDARNFPINWRKMSRSGLIEDLQSLSLNSTSWKAALLQNLQRGARFFPHPLSLKEIRERITRKQQMIMYVDSAVLYQHADGVWGHYIVPQKATSTKFNIFDPHWKYGGIKTYSIDLILFAFYSVGGYCFFLSKNKTL